MDKPGEAWRQIVARLFFGPPGTPPSYRPFKRSRYQHPRRLPQKKIAISYQIVAQNANTDLPLRIAVLVFVCLLSRSFRQSTLIERLLCAPERQRLGPPSRLARWTSALPPIFPTVDPAGLRCRTPARFASVFPFPPQTLPGWPLPLSRRRFVPSCLSVIDCSIR